MKIMPEVQGRIFALRSFFLVISLLALTPNAQDDKRFYRLCTSTEKLASCEEMVSTYAPQKIKCVAGNDKIDCIEKITRNEVDFVPLDPEEIYVAHRFNRDGFSIISEIRSTTFKDRDFRYEPVAVVRKSSGIRSIDDLAGKKSCHTGFGRNAGWKIPFSHLMDKGQLPKFCEALKAPTPEKDLNAVSQYFSAACAGGSWVPEKNKDTELKKKYPNLCSLCEDPSTCLKDDKYGGYEGALKCLTMKSADIAWTKMDAVQSFFKLQEASPMPNVHEYEFLCWDGSSMPLTSKDPCSWAKRPWSSYVSSSRLSPEDIAEVQKQISTLRDKGVEEGKNSNVVPIWLKEVLEVSYDKVSATFDIPTSIDPHTAKLLRPITYLNNGKNYSVTIEKPSCATESSIKFCVKSEVEKSKCVALGLAAMGRRVLPKVHCVLAESTLDCIQKVARSEADLVNLDPKDAEWAGRNYNLVPILSELEGSNRPDESEPYRYALAVVKSSMSDNFRNMSRLRGHKSCHGSVRSLQGWNVPLTVLRDQGLIGGPTCGLTLQMTSFFGNMSCVPGVKDLSIPSKMPWLNSKALCSLCAGDGSRPGTAFSPETVCSDSDSERYYGDSGALRCLSDSVADIAFVDHVGLHQKALKDPNFPLNATDLRLLCPSGSSMSVDQYQHCNWGKVSSRSILARGGDDNLIKREDVRLTMLKISETFSPGGKADKVLRLFGPFFGNKDLLFQDTSVGLCDYKQASPKEKELITDFDYCTTSSATSNHALNLFLVFSFTLLACFYASRDEV